MRQPSEAGECTAIWFSRRKEVQRGAWVSDGRIVFRDAAGQQEIMLVADIPLKGAHNVENALAGVCVGMLAGSRPERIREAIRNFKAVEHQARVRRPNSKR